MPFDDNDPVNTPNTLNTSNSSVQKALSDAQATVANSGIGFNTPLGQTQYSAVNTASGGANIPIFGAEADPMGSFTAAYSNGLTKTGYPIDFGNSYIQTVTWDNGGVHAEGFITYSESTDPANPHYSDFTQAYSQKQWYRFPFHAAEVQAAAESTIVLTGPGDAAAVVVERCATRRTAPHFQFRLMRERQRGRCGGDGRIPGRAALCSISTESPNSCVR